jgi:putative transposase
MLLQGGLAIDRMCFLGGVSRAGFYRYLRAQDPCEEEMAVRSEVQRIELEHQGRYGYRRITAELRRQGMPVNHKRVARLMREDNFVGTELHQRLGDLPDPEDRGEIYINLANRLKLTGPNQVWVTDITFVRLKTRVRLSCCCARQILAKSRWLEPGQNSDCTITAGCVGDGA